VRWKKRVARALPHNRMEAKMGCMEKGVTTGTERRQRSAHPARIALEFLPRGIGIAASIPGQNLTPRIHSCESLDACE